MNHWDLLNKFKEELYLEKKPKAEMQEHFNQLKKIAIAKDDLKFMSSVLEMNECINSLSTTDKLLWEASYIDNQTYPPIELHESGTYFWGNSLVCELRNPKLLKKYTRQDLIQKESKLLSIEQSPDIEDCSLVCSLINIQKRNLQLLMLKEALPNIYMINFAFNGSLRLVIIDLNYVPTTVDGLQLTLQSNDLTLRIIEQAYLLTFVGSFESRGSNAAIDTYRLIGYYPEITNNQCYDIATLLKYQESGICLIAIGTSAALKENSIGLIPGHDYPVLGVDRESSSLIIRDPLNSKLIISVDSNCLKIMFSQLYINWDVKSLFKHGQDLIFKYNSHNNNKFTTVSDKPVFQIVNKSSKIESVWLLLETHISSINKITRGVSYIQEVPTDILKYIVEDPDGVTDMGLQLIKIKLKPAEVKTYFCHSAHSAMFSLHLMSITKKIYFKQLDKLQNLYSLQFTMQDSIDYINLESQNCCFRLRLNSDVKKNIIIKLQVLSEDHTNELKFNIFHSTDYELARPVFNSHGYSIQRYTQEEVVMSTNHDYDLYLSVRNPKVNTSYKLILLMNGIDENVNSCKIGIQRHHPQFNGLPYQFSLKCFWKPESNRRKFKLTAYLKSRCFIRICPKLGSRLSKFRCNVFDETTHRFLYNEETYKSTEVGGIVLSDLDILDDSNLILLVEYFNYGTNDMKLDDDEYFTLMVGSSIKVIINEV